MQADPGPISTFTISTFPFNNNSSTNSLVTTLPAIIILLGKVSLTFAQNSINLEEIAVRDAIHSIPLLNTRWFSVNGDIDVSTVVENVGNAFVACSKTNLELSQKIFDTLIRWNVLDANFRVLVAKYCRDKYFISSTIV